jgi:hypothetical protein
MGVMWMSSERELMDFSFHFGGGGIHIDLACCFSFFLLLIQTHTLYQ